MFWFEAISAEIKAADLIKDPATLTLLVAVLLVHLREVNFVIAF